MAEKNLPPSHQRIRRARESGQIGLSKDLVSLARFAVVAELAFGAEAYWRTMLGQMVAAALDAVQGGLQAKLTAAGALLQKTALLLAVMAALAAATALAITLLQTRFNIAPKAFESGWKKLDPASNLKQLFSGQKLLMLVTGPLKVAVVGIVCWVQIRGMLPDLLRVYRLDLLHGWSACMVSLHALERAAVAALLVLGLADFGLQRFLNWRSLRMSHEEAVRDHKESEGDPHAKGHRKELAKSILLERRPAAAARPNAVVVNPEHIAIALAYDFSEESLPRVLAKAADAQALRLRQQAMREGVPVIRYPALARLLYAVGREGDFVPSPAVRATALLYAAVRELGQTPHAAGDEFEIPAELAEAMLPLHHAPSLH
jgi:type III secretion protein U